MAVDPNDLDNSMAVYAGYRNSLTSLSQLCALIVSPTHVEPLTLLQDLLVIRLNELRKAVKAGSGVSFEELLASTLERLHMSADMIDLVSVAQPVERDPRLDHLFAVFSKPNDIEDPAMPECRSPIKINRSQSRRLSRVRRKSLSTINQNKQLTETEAVTRISAIYRMIKAKRAFISSREAELEKLGLVPPLEDPPCVAEADKFILKRREMSKRYSEEWLLFRSAALEEYKRSAKDKLAETFSVETRRGIWEYRKSQGRFPDSVESFLSPPPAATPTVSKKQNSQKKSNPVIPTVETASVWSTRAEIANWVDSFDWDATPVLISEKDRNLVNEELKKEMIEELNRQLREWKSQDPKNQPDSLSEIQTNVPLPVEQQDIIDLIKEGILVRPRKISFSDIYANVFSVSGLASVKSELIESVVIPLSSEVVWAHVSCARTILLHGPKQCGKKSILHAIAHDSGAVVLRISKDTKSETFENIFRVASHLAPAVILVERLEQQSASTGKKTKKEPPFIDLVIEKFNQHVNADKRVILIACSANDSLVEKFNRHIPIPYLGEDDRAEFIKQTLLNRGLPVRTVRANLILIRTVARLLTDTSTKDIKTIIESVRSFRLEDFELAIARHRNNSVLS